MDRRRAVAALLALAACSAAAPTANNQTALELSDGPTEGCYYNFQHYGEGDRIMTNEPCLNCTCHNRMLMCYLRVCPFTKPIGQDCTVEKRADQCCPIVTCPDVPVDLLTSTSTSSPAEYGTTGVGKHDRYGCSINGKYFSEGSKVPPTPNKPCEHCYCIRNMTTCVMQECTLHVDGCTPIYHKDVCCPVRYSCDHPEDEIPLLDDMTTTVRPTPGFLLTTTTVSPVTQLTQDCVHDDEIFPDGAHIKTDKACEHCYCMKGDIVCVVQGCGTPMENEGKNCTALPLRPGQCCPDTYICEGDEQAGDLTTEIILQTTIPPRRVAVEGSGYRNEPGEPFTEMSPFEIDDEGSGDEYATTVSIDTVAEDVTLEKESYEKEDEILKLTTEKGMQIGLNTEPDKEQNTIPDISSNKESSTLPAEDMVSQTTEQNKELVATTTINTIPDKHERVEDDVPKKDELLTTESVFRKEDSDIISDEVLLHKEHDELTTTFINLIDTTPNKEENEVDISTGTDLPSEHDNKATTETVKYTSGYLNTVSQKETTTEKQSESTTTEINILNGEYPSGTASETNVYGTSTKAVTESMDVPDTTPINININEVSDNISLSPPGRIPGEGDCLLNGITYTNNTTVPRTNNCHTSCRCVSSIIKCDPIVCIPPPEYMENMNDCQPVYDSPDSCCPTYVCSPKETIPPQSHNQMSGTESPKPIAESDCTDNNCGSDKEQKPDSESSIICTSDGCSSKPVEQPIIQSQGDCILGNCDNLPQIPVNTSEGCSGVECHEEPVIACDDENCKTKPAQVVDTSATCDGKEGCKKPINAVQDDCKDDICKNKEITKEESSISADTVEVTTKTVAEENIQTTQAPVSDIQEIQTEPLDVTKHSDIDTNVPEKTITLSDTKTETNKLDSDDKAIQTELPITVTETEITDEDIDSSKKDTETETTLSPPIVSDDTKHPLDDHEVISKEPSKSEETITEMITEGTEYTEKLSTDKTTDKELSPTVTTELINTKSEEMFTKSHELDSIDKVTESTINDLVHTTVQHETVTDKMELDETEHTTDKSIVIKPELSVTEEVKEEDTYSDTTSTLPETNSDNDTYEHITQKSPESELDITEQTTPQITKSVVDNNTDKYEEFYGTSKLPEIEIVKEDVYFPTDATPKITQTNIALDNTELEESQPEKSEVVIDEEYSTSEMPGLPTDLEKDNSGESDLTSSPKFEITTEKDNFAESQVSSELPGTEINEDTLKESVPTLVSPTSDKDVDTNIYKESFTTLRLPTIEKEKDTFGETDISSELPITEADKEKDIYEELHPTSELTEKEKDSNTLEGSFTTTKLPEIEMEKDDLYGDLHTSTSKLPEADTTKKADVYEEYTTSISPGIGIEQDKDTYEEIHIMSTPKNEMTTQKDIYEVSHTTLKTPQTETDKDTKISDESYTTTTLPESDKNINGEAHTVQVLPIEEIEKSTIVPEPTILVDVESDKIQKATESPEMSESHSTAGEKVNNEPIDTSELPKYHTIKDEIVNITEVVTESSKTTTDSSQKLQPSVYEITTQLDETITEKHEIETITEKQEGYNELSTLKPDDVDQLILEKETKISTSDKNYPSTVPTIIEVTNPVGTESDYLATDLPIDTKITESPITKSQDVSPTVTEKELTAETEDGTVINSEAPEIQSTVIEINKDKLKEESFTELPYSPPTYTALKETIIPNDKISETHDVETENPLQSSKEPDVLDGELPSTESIEVTTLKTSEQHTQKQEVTFTEVTPKYTLADDRETKHPVNAEVDDKDLETHELTTPVSNADIMSVVDKQTEVPITDMEKSQEKFTISTDNKVSTEQDTIITTTQRLTANDLFIDTNTNKVTNENEYTTQQYASEPLDLNTVTVKDISLTTVIVDKEDHMPEKPQDDTDNKVAEQTTIHPILEQKLTEVYEQNESEHTTAKTNLDIEKESDLSIPITDSSVNTEEQQFVTQTPKVSTEEYISKITEIPASTQKSIQDESVTEEIKLTTILETEITKGEIKHEVFIETSPEQPESHTKLQQTITTTESMLISADKDFVPDIDHVLIPGDKIYENKTVPHSTTLSPLLAEEDKKINDSMVTSKDSLNIETEAESSTKMSSDQMLDEELKRVTETHELVTEIPEYAIPHDTTQTEQKVTAGTVVTSVKPESPLHLTTLLPSYEVTNVEQNDISATEPQSGYEINEVTSEKVIPTEVEEMLPISDEEAAHTDSLIPIEIITSRPSAQVSVKEEDVTEIIQTDSTTHPPKIIEAGQDDELKITNSMLDNQEDNRINYPTTEITPEIDSDKMTTESYKQEIISATQQTSIYPAEENVINEVTKEEHRITTIETFISSEVTTSSKMKDFTTEKQEMLPVHVLDTTESEYETVTEQKESDIVIPDIATEQPDKKIPEKAIDDIIQETSDKSESPQEEILHEKVTQQPDLLGEKEFTTVAESYELPLITTTSKDKKEDQLKIYSTQIPLQTEEAVTHKELHVESTTEDMAHIPDLVSNPDIPLSTQKHEEPEKHKYTTDLEYTFTETTPFSIELEEHTHAVVDESSSIIPITEDSSIIHQEPERGDITPDQSDSSEKDQEKLSPDITTQKEKIEEPVTRHITTIKDDTKSEETTEQILPSFTSIDLNKPKIETTHGEELITTSPKTINEQEIFTTEHDKLTSPIHDSETSTEKDGLKPLEPAPSEHTTVPEEQLIQEVQKATTVKFEEETYTYSPTPDDKLSKPEDKPSDMNIPELPKPVFNEEPVDNLPSPDFPPSGSAGYGQEPDYVEEDQAFGPGTCRYGGKVYVSAQQIPRDDPCDFCFCFRSDIICLQQSCPPPIHGCHEEPIQGFCCPRYECPVSMATTLNMTTTTTTTTTTLPPHFLPHAYKGAAQRRGCQIKGHTYKVGEVVRASSGPCLHCTCGGDGQMKCDPKACTPEPMLRQMIAAAVSAKRRR